MSLSVVAAFLCVLADVTCVSVLLAFETLDYLAVAVEAFRNLHFVVEEYSFCDHTIRMCCAGDFHDKRRVAFLVVWLF